MIEDDGGVRKRPGEIAEFFDLSVVAPALETQIPRRQVRKPFTEAALCVKPAWRTGAVVGDGRIIISGGGLPDAPEPASAGDQLCVQHARDGVARTERGRSNNPCCYLRVSVVARCAHRGDAVGKLGLADGPHLSRSVAPPHRTALDEDAGNNVVAAAGIGQELIQ